MTKILISSCLLGERVKYNGGDNRVLSTILETWLRDDRLLPFCPEVTGGLPVPRNPVELQNGEGADLLQGKATAIDTTGCDVSDYFVKGAQAALELAQKHAVTIAILKERSPSCGSHLIYSGNFDGTVKPGKGVTASLLEQHGIKVFSEFQLEEVERLLSAGREDTAKPASVIE
jgi:uncharacterized protein YbbK (DUF523 family)